MNALVYLAINNRAVRRSSLEVLSRCVAIPQIDRVEAVLIGSGASELCDVASRHGAEKIYVLGHPGYDAYQNASLVSALQKVDEICKPDLIACASTEEIKDVVGALAVRVGASAIPDVASFDVEDRRVTAVRPVMAAKKLARVRSTTEKVVVSVRSGSYDASEAPQPTEVLEVDFEAKVSEGSSLREVLSTKSDSIELSEADVVVSSGRGVKDSEGQQLVGQLSSLLGAAQGATRAVVENGMFPATAQIGQTGKVVSPNLYFAIGLSGAIQHVAGMANSKVIVAINKDPDAPIFDYATYGVVGDLYKVLPELISRLEEKS